MIHKVLRMVRAYHHVNQIELSKQTGVSKTVISDLETGKKQPTLKTLEKYAKYFKIPPSAFLLYSELLNKEHEASEEAATKLRKILNWIQECDEFEKANLTKETK